MSGDHGRVGRDRRSGEHVGLASSVKLRAPPERDGHSRRRLAAGGRDTADGRGLLAGVARVAGQGTENRRCHPFGDSPGVGLGDSHSHPGV